MHPSLTLEKRIAAELASYDGQMSVFADDMKGNIVAVGPDEPFETASTIKTYILASLFDRAEKGLASLDDMLTYRPEHFVDGSGVFRDLSFGTSSIWGLTRSTPAFRRSAAGIPFFIIPLTLKNMTVWEPRRPEIMPVCLSVCRKES